MFKNLFTNFGKQVPEDCDAREKGNDTLATTL